MINLSYIKNVLGASVVLRPSYLDQHYSIESSLNKECLLFTDKAWTKAHQSLAQRMMQAVQQDSWTLIHLKTLSWNWVQTLLSRSPAQKVIFFGSAFQVLSSKRGTEQHQVHSLKGQARYFITYSLDELSEPSLSKEEMKKRKLKTFESLKSLCL